ncbi:hypothetical protein LP420_09760 [Massilia sp. B-10]|nr:hypothetical protein LP420_09760 [Massilia sp. B-10]
MNRNHKSSSQPCCWPPLQAPWATSCSPRRGAPLRERVARLTVKDKPTVMGWPVAVSEVAGGFSDPFGVVLDRARATPTWPTAA